MIRSTRIWRSVVAMVAVGILGGASNARASFDFTVTGSDTSGHSASVEFIQSGTTLEMILQNTGKAASVPGDVLTALFFSISGATISPNAGHISTPSFAPNQPLYGNTLGGAWAYNPTSPGTGSTGLGGVWGVGSPNVYWNTPNGPNGQTGKGVDGINFGIANGIAANANSAITTGVFEDPSVTFWYNITSGSLADPSQVTVSKFQYGTSSTDTSITPVPEASTLLAGALLLLPFGASTARVLFKHRTVSKLG